MSTNIDEINERLAAIRCLEDLQFGLKCSDESECIEIFCKLQHRVISAKAIYACYNRGSLTGRLVDLINEINKVIAGITEVEIAKQKEAIKKLL